MTVTMISKALVSASYHSKLEELAALGVDLDLVLPRHWGGKRTEIEWGRGYRIHFLPCYFSGKNHFHFYGGLRKFLEDHKPGILHIDEESYSLVTFQALRVARRLGIPALFFNWQNIYKKYPFPFSWFEWYNIHYAHGAIAGNEEARDVLLRKGCTIPIHVIPQFGVDPQVFSKRDPGDLRKHIFGAGELFVVGFGGRLVEEKGLRVLLDAFSALPHQARLLVVGTGPMKRAFLEEARRGRCADRVVVLDGVRSSDMPRYLNCMDCVVLPSLTRSNWKEQFGRILVEAMSCEVPVIGSDSGEIPRVIGGSGVVVPEGNPEALRAALQGLLEDGLRRKDLGRIGRERVLAHFTQSRIAVDTVTVYREMLKV